MRPLLLLKCGRTFPGLIERRGDYQAWFARSLRSPLRVCEVHAGERPPPPAELAGVVVSGAPASVLDGERWIDETAAWLRAAAAEGVPILGVCFGHQLVAHAWGGRVRRNPRGWECGTQEIALTAAGRDDPLFAGVPGRFPAQCSHRDDVEPPPGTVVLAENAAGVQALAVGDRVRGVQFHPEADDEVARGLVTHRAETLRAAGLDPEALAGAVRPAPQALRVLANFEERFVRF